MADTNDAIAGPADREEAVTVSFQVIDGVDKGRQYLDLQPAITIGREEGNSIRLNDDRISRYHLKVQCDDDKIVLTDLDSTNGTRVNGEPVNLRVLRLGDRITLGRSTLLYGTRRELDELRRLTERAEPAEDSELDRPPTPPTNMQDPPDGTGQMPSANLPSLPHRLSTSQAAQLSELLDYLHRQLARVTSSVVLAENAEQATLTIEQWRRVQLIQSQIAVYCFGVSEPSDEP